MKPITKIVITTLSLAYLGVNTVFASDPLSDRFLQEQILAEQGDAEAQYNIGFMYYNGMGVKQDYTQAVKWLRKSAEQGDADADARGIYYLMKAAEQGHSLAQTKLGDRYYNGSGVEKNYKQAIYWYKKAGSWGNERAQLQLAIMYSLGQGVRKDDIIAYRWAVVALRNASGRSWGDEQRIKKIREIIERLEQRMTATQIDRAQNTIDLLDLK